MPATLGRRAAPARRPRRWPPPRGRGPPAARPPAKRRPASLQCWRAVAARGPQPEGLAGPRQHQRLPAQGHEARLGPAQSPPQVEVNALFRDWRAGCARLYRTTPDYTEDPLVKKGSHHLPPNPGQPDKVTRTPIFIQRPSPIASYCPPSSSSSSSSSAFLLVLALVIFVIPLVLIFLLLVLLLLLAILPLSLRPPTFSLLFPPSSSSS